MLANKIINSLTLKEDLETACRQSKIELKQMICDVSTHWNSTAELVQHALELSPALKILIVKVEHNKHNYGVCLHCF